MKTFIIATVSFPIACALALLLLYEYTQIFIINMGANHYGYDKKGDQMYSWAIASYSTPGFLSQHICKWYIYIFGSEITKRREPWSEIGNIIRQGASSLPAGGFQSAVILQRLNDINIYYYNASIDDAIRDKTPAIGMVTIVAKFRL